MTAEADLEWLTERDTARAGGVVDCELRELPQEPAEVLAAIEELADELGLKGHAAGGRGRWGLFRYGPYLHATVRAAAARPGTAVTVQIHTVGDRMSSEPSKLEGWAAFGVVGCAVLVFREYFFVAALVGSVVPPVTLDWLKARRERASHRAAQEHGVEWRRRFWELLERRLATRTPYRSPGS